MDLMDRGTLASAVRRGAFVDPTDNTIRAVSSSHVLGKLHRDQARLSAFRWQHSWVLINHWSII